PFPVRPKVDPRAAILVAVISISFASIFIKWSEAPALAIAAYRLGFATLIILIPTLLLNRRELFHLSRRETVILALVGVALAFHFGFWISSLKYTSVANSVILVSTHPILIAIISHYYMGERISYVAGLGVGIALFGMVIIGSGDLAFNQEFLLGDFLALLGMFALAAYLLSGRKLRQKTSVLPYVTVVYGSATVFLFIACLLFNVPLFPYQEREWILFLALAIVPMILGHTVYNWTLKYVTTLVVSMSILFEPILSATLAAFLLVPPEIPSTWVLVGGILILVGIYLVASRSGNPRT
ncbi:MAG: DMT family transporter, partial [Thermoplasmata archaeon]